MKKATLTRRFDTSVDVDLAEWIADHASREQRSTASILRRALIAYRQDEEAKQESVRVLGTARKEQVA